MRFPATLFLSAALSLAAAPVISQETSTAETTTEASIPSESTVELQAAIVAEDARHLIEVIRAEGFQAPDDAEIIQNAIKILEAHVKPLPASQAEANWHGYDALSILSPDTAVYAQKRDSYEDRYYANRAGILKRLKTSRDEFKEITWYKHPTEPRYTDTRTFLTLYMGQQKDHVWLRFYLNYTNDSWLFINKALAKIDGELVALPLSDWKRDNDSEIWEWSDVYLKDDLRDIARRIGESKETIIRFEGSKYYDNWTVPEKDKKAIRDMLQAEEILKEQVSKDS